MKMRKKIRRGFTLVELVVVIAVIAILSAVSVGAYFGITDSANSSNATHGSKQIKDIWTMYAVSDYENFDNIDEMAQDFCLRYAVDMGPSYEVNYKVVNVKQNPNSLAARDEAGEGVLFKIETNYPTWFLVKGQEIIDESIAPSKNNGEFNNSLLASTRLNLSSYTTDLSNPEYEFPFTLQTVGVDSNGKNIRGFGFYRVDVSYIHSDNSTSEEIMIVEEDTILGNVNTSLNIDQTITTNGVTAPLVKVYDDNNDAVDTRVPLEFKKLETIDRYHNCVGNMTEEYTSSVVQFPKYSYILNENYHITSETMVESDVNMNNYSFALIKVSTPAGVPDASALTFISESDFQYDYEILSTSGKTVEYVGLRKKVKTYEIKDYVLNYSLETNISDVNAKFSEENNSKYFLFVSNYTFKEDFEIPSNVVMMVDYENSIDQMMEFVRRNCKNVYTETYCESTATLTKTGWRSLPSIELKDYQNKSFSYDESRSTDIILSHQLQVFFDTFDQSRFGGSYINNEEHIKVNSNVNNVKVDNNATLTFAPNSYLMVEGVVYPAAGNQPLSLSNHGTLEVKKGSKIILNNAKFRSLGITYGEGSIEATNNSEVIELFKPQDYEGGAFTANSILNDGSSGRPLFPFLNYRFDNIQCNLKICHGSALNALTGFNMNNKTFVPTPIRLLSSSEDSIFNILDTNSYVIKNYDCSSKKMGIDIYGNISDGLFKMQLDIKELIGGTAGNLIEDVPQVLNYFNNGNISSDVYNFPISNMNIHINKDSSLIFDTPKTRYEMLPSSYIVVDGTLTVNNNSKLVLLTSNDFADVTKDQSIFSGINKYDESKKLADFNVNELILINEGGRLDVGLFEYNEETSLFECTAANGYLYSNYASAINAHSNSILNICTYKTSDNVASSYSWYVVKVSTESKLCFNNFAIDLALSLVSKKGDFSTYKRDISLVNQII